MGALASGGCLCGAVRYRASGALHPVVACHCSQCRRASGHFTAATAASRAALTIDDPRAALAWYRSSPAARRGFCRTCGSSLFWQRDGDTLIAIMAGTLEAPTGLRTQAHIFVADKGDYYLLEGGAAQHAQGDHGLWPSADGGNRPV